MALAPELRLSVNSSLKTEVNRVRKNRLLRNIDEQSWSEYTTRRLSLAPTTEDRIANTVTTGKVVFFESDNPVELNASKVVGIFLPEAKVVLALGGEYEVVETKNTSATLTANVLLTVVD